MNVPGAAGRWWAPRQPGWARNTLLAVGVGLAVGLAVLAVVAPLAPGGSGVAAAPTASPSPSGSGLVSIVLPGASAPVPPSASATAAPSPSRTALPSRSAPPPAGLSARYAVKDTWDGGFSGELTITATRAVEGWTAILTLPAGVDVSIAWEADYRQDGRKLTLTPKSWNAAIAAGSSITLGFQASGTGGPTACTVNATPCTLA
ncbi:MAG: hypothetical protein HOV79_30765 [Hamadaea sp.]|nr:hypothetical protein [Hamadaea sp.]